jgi:hypothetical protein
MNDPPSNSHGGVNSQGMASCPAPAQGSGKFSQRIRQPSAERMAALPVPRIPVEGGLG